MCNRRFASIKKERKGQRIDVCRRGASTEFRGGPDMDVLDLSIHRPWEYLSRLLLTLLQQQQQTGSLWMMTFGQLSSPFYPSRPLHLDFV